MGLADQIATLKVPQGRFEGQSIDVLDWQRRLLAAFDREGVSRLAFSAARANGKTTLMAAVAWAAISNDRREADVLIVASAFAQARASLGRYLKAFCLQSDQRWRIRDSKQEFHIENPRTGSAARILGCDPKRAHGQAPQLVLADEPAQWPVSGEEMYSALNTSMGKIPGSQFAAFSTRPAAHHWFARMLADEGEGQYSQLHAAPMGCDPFCPKSWELANPSLDHFPDLLAAIQSEAKAAERDPTLLPAFRAFRLNAPIDVQRRTIVAVSDWERLEHSGAGREGLAYVGVDIGGANSLTGLAVYWPSSSRLEVYAGIGSNPPLAVRGKRDGQPYERWASTGELCVYPSRVTPVAEFVAAVSGKLAGVDVAHVESDTYKPAEFEDAIDRSGVQWPVLTVRRANKSKPGGAADVRAFQRAVLSGSLHCAAGRELLEYAIGASVIRLDPAGNEVLDKQSHNSRIDCLSAAVIAIGAAAAQPVADWSGYQITTAENAQ